VTNENKEQREQEFEASRANVLSSKNVVEAFIYTPFANGKSRKFSVKVGVRASLPAVSFEQGKTKPFGFTFNLFSHEAVVRSVPRPNELCRQRCLRSG
jgi:hypothetical protein